MNIVRWKDAISWRWLVVRQCWFLLRTFRNGSRLASCYQRRLPCERAVLWNGTELLHPPGRGGFVETLLEVWHEEVYTGRFYRPAAGDVIIDAGANVGLSSIWLSWLQPGCLVLAFEPFAENFEFLQRNLAAARVENVTAHQAAIGKTTGRGVMSNVGKRSLDHRLSAANGDQTEATIPMYSFADVLRMAGAERIALAKIDIEGSEHDVFSGMTADDIKRVDHFAVEYHDHVRPGTSTMIQARLAETHAVSIYPAGDEQYGMLYATRL